MTLTAPSDTASGNIEPDLASTDPSVIFKDGLVGQPEWKRFVLLVEDAEELPVAVLQSLDDPDCTMLVADPRMVEPSYTVNLSPEDRATLSLDSEGEPVL